MTLKPGLRVTQGHRNRYGSTHHLRFAINIPKHCSFCSTLRPRWRGSLGISYRRWVQKTRMMVLPGRQRSLTISLTVWIECTNVYDRQMDGQRDTGPQQTPRLRIASHSKNQSPYLCENQHMHWSIETQWGRRMSTHFAPACKWHADSMSRYGTKQGHGYYVSLIRSHMWPVDLCRFPWPRVTFNSGTRAYLYGRVST